MIDRFTVVDGHVHTFSSYEVAHKIMTAFNKVYNIEFTNPGTGAIDEVLQNMQDIGIDFTVTANFAPAKIIHKNNTWSIEMARQYKKIVPLVSFHPDMEEPMDKLMEEYVSGGAKGIKFHPMAQGFLPYDERLEIIYRMCEEVSFPVVFHCGRVSNARINNYADIENIVPVIKKYRKIPFILTHMADGNIGDVFKIADMYENVYFDTSIIITGYPPLLEVNEPSWPDNEVVEYVIKKIGADRVVFGSDFPWGSPKHDLARFMEMKLSDTEKSMILGENAIKIFKIKTKN
ncbi:MAG TPA: amidohydrolase family protein [Acetivibrio clariflavus]|nr:amidohydrolase family protein [Acetivibrio clariflavus]